MNIETMIYSLRGHKVMLDSDLAKLYGVETKRLIEQVKRNPNRFPEDFMLICSDIDLESLRSQFATANLPTPWNHKRRTNPMVFTENGIAMLSSVLHSEQAIEVNIAIMRTFTKLRNSLLAENRLSKIERKIDSVDKIFKIVFERIDSIEDQIIPKLSPQRKKIGLRDDKK